MDSLGMRPGGRPPLPAGGTALSLASSSFYLEVLRTLAEESQSLRELMRRLGFPPRSTMRQHLRTLTELDAVKRLPRSEFPASVDYEITAAGRSLIGVAETLQAWLDRSPAGSMELDGPAAKSAIKALVEGWRSNLVHILAMRPLALTELNRLIPRISYPSLERRLTAMRQVDLLEVRSGKGRTSPYEVTDWLRRAAVPVVAAMRWEWRCAPQETARLRRLDIEALFLLAMPLVRLEEPMSGRCKLRVQTHNGASPAFAGVLVSLKQGEVTDCAPNLDGEAEAWAVGRPLDWLRELSDATGTELAFGGEEELARKLAAGLRCTVNEPH